ncbi:hypothetical protein BFP97_03765 [Roseivirga sp. 4D4]|uniref:DUF7009 family protein n=1 Tax=Roseivirga sp. 4D4 TaxID=1889784 RepID=UPI00085331A0|nr:hypothetical protein [Roseivirga sp. 4D4]OEK00676.1 hypothetical protein BFP97_03765 [Roseivirga sp. 4D4]
MKLRIQDNSIRFRLTQTEVSNFGTTGSCVATVQFPNGNELVYQLTIGDKIASSFADNTIDISLPKTAIESWIQSDQVGIKGELPLENGDKLSILVEKDFKCLTARSEDESDMFPNPKESH